MKTCLHAIPSSIEQRGSEWPDEWPKRLDSFPDWLNDKEKLIADNNHWRSIVEKSYIPGMGIDWSNIRNVMDMKAIYGGYAKTNGLCILYKSLYFLDFPFSFIIKKITL